MGIKFIEKGKISNRTVTCVSIDSEKLKMAKERNINVSLLLDGALSRELLIENKDAYQEAIERQNQFLRGYVEDRSLQKDLDKYQGGEKDVLEEEKTRPEREDREDKSSVGEI